MVHTRLYLKLKEMNMAKYSRYDERNKKKRNHKDKAKNGDLKALKGYMKQNESYENFEYLTENDENDD